jgi:hypothetical protein
MRLARLALVTTLAMSACAPERPPPPPPQAGPDLRAEAKGAIESANPDRALLVAARMEAAGDAAGAAKVRVAVAAQRHDAAALQAVLASPAARALRGDPTWRAKLATALAWTVGPAAAAEEDEAVCAGPALPPTSKARRDACARAALARAARGQPRTFEGADEAAVDLLQGPPLPIVLASVNGLRPEPFIVDTGAATSVLSKAYCDRAGIPYLAEHAHPAEDAGASPVTLYPALVGSLALGGVTVKSWTAEVIALPENFKIGGILAPQDTLRGVVSELDMRARKLRIHRSQTIEQWAAALGEPASSFEPVWDTGNLYVHARVGDGVEGLLNFDTGAAGSLLHLGVAKKLGYVPTGEVKEGLSAGGKHRVFAPFEALLSVAGSAPVRARFVPVDRSPRAGIARMGNLGLPWLTGRRMAISPDGRRILFTGVKGP